MHASRTCSGNGFCNSLATLPLLLANTRSIALVSALSLLLAACGGGGGGSPAPNFGGNSPGSTTGSTTTTPTAPVVPIYSIGNGSGTGFTSGVIDTNKTTLESGDSATLRVNLVDQSNNPPAVDLAVAFSSTCTSAGLATFGTVTQVTRGLFSTSYTNGGCDKAADIVTATLTTSTPTDNGRQATATIKMVGPQVLSVSFVSSTQTQLALAGIGGNESSELTFKVSGPQGVPVVGKTVDFSINTKVGGATILAGRETSITDQAGNVRTVLNSGTIAGPVNVKAVERSTGRQGISSDIVISTGVADASRFSLSYTPQNPGLAYGTDLVAVTVTVIASDIFGNNPTDGTRVSFVSPESGNIQSSCLLQNGICSVVWRSSGSRPDDMRATILAYTSGAEHFVDNNGNSVYDSTDVPITTLVNNVSYDTGEPYADQNENGKYDLGEYYFDTNKNGVWDGANSQWDGPCLSKVDARAICTGQPTVAIFGKAVIVMSQSDPRFKTLGTFPAANTTISVHQGNSVSFSGMVLEDGNSKADSLGGNPLPNGTTVAFTIDGSGVSLKGITNYIVTNGIRPEDTPAFGVTIAADAVVPPAAGPTNVVLRMRVTAPGLLSETDWPISVQVP